MENLLGPRDDNGIPVPMTVDESIASMKASLLKKIKRSAYVYRVDCGGCNGCEIEIFATLSPLFDAERFGIKVVPSPRHDHPFFARFGNGLNDGWREHAVHAGHHQ
jgi:Ni,Fe-hydrogenase III small subunit